MFCCISVTALVLVHLCCVHFAGVILAFLDFQKWCFYLTIFLTTTKSADSWRHCMTNIFWCDTSYGYVGHLGKNFQGLELSFPFFIVLVDGCDNAFDFLLLLRCIGNWNSSLFSFSFLYFFGYIQYGVFLLSLMLPNASLMFHPVQDFSVICRYCITLVFHGIDIFFLWKWTPLSARNLCCYLLILNIVMSLR